MQSLQALQNGQLGSKIKIAKNRPKHSQRHVRVVRCRKRLQETPHIREMTSFSKTSTLAKMQRLQALHNGQFGSKIKIAKNMPKTSLEKGQSCFVQKRLHKTPNIRDLAKMQRLQALQNGQLGSKIKIAKNRPKHSQRHVRVVCCRKRLQKRPNIREIKSFQKWPKLTKIQRLQAFHNGQFGSKIKIAKNMPKTSLETCQSCSVQKTAPKNN